MDEEIEKYAIQLLKHCTESGLGIATAESCTGGLIAAAFTSIPGSSRSFLAGLVCYSNKAKMKFLGVARDLLKQEGAVSEACARAMAEGALAQTGAGLALSTTGIAGPGGGTPERPVGLVHIAAATEKETRHLACQFGDQPREAIRRQSVIAALQLGCALVE